MLLELTLTAAEVLVSESDCPVRLFAEWRIELGSTLVRREGVLRAPRWALRSMRDVAIAAGIPLTFHEERSAELGA
jgi:hypothetical protein